MRACIALGIAFVALTGCAAQAPADASDARLRDARWAVYERERAVQELQLRNQLLASDLKAERAAAVERAELSHRVDELSHSNHALAEAVSRLQQGDAHASPTPAPAAAPVQTVETTDEEMRRLRAQLANAGFNGVTLTPAQVRALLRALRPPRPIDVESPFAM